MNPLWLIEQYYVKNSLAYNILIHHSQMVAEHAVDIARRHPELKADIPFLMEAAMLHDIGIIFTNASAIGCYGDHPYICHGYLGREILEKAGLPIHARVCERHTGTGMTKQEIIDQDLPIPHRDMRPETIEEQIICYADKFYSKGAAMLQLRPFEIRKNLEKFGEEKVQQFDIWSEMFG